MKKIIALVLALPLMATMVFAEPVVLASEIIQTTDLISEADSMEPLFADVEAPQLAAVEAEQVEGGFWPVVVAVVVAAAVVGAAAYAGYKGYSINFFSAGR